MVAEKVFAVIAESTRRDILEALAQESKAVGQLVDELGVSQPTVSKHLRVLREAGVVSMRAQGQKRFYAINTEPLAMVSTWLESLGAGSAPAQVPEPAPVTATGKNHAGATAADNNHDRLAARSTNSESLAPRSTATSSAAAARFPETAAPAKAAVSTSGSIVARQGVAVVQPNEIDASVQGQISRGVGRAANKAAEVLASLPKLRRKRDS